MIWLLGLRLYSQNRTTTLTTRGARIRYRMNVVTCSKELAGSGLPGAFSLIYSYVLCKTKRPPQVRVKGDMVRVKGDIIIIHTCNTHICNMCHVTCMVHLLAASSPASRTPSTSYLPLGKLWLHYMYSFHDSFSPCLRRGVY